MVRLKAIGLPCTIRNAERLAELSSLEIESLRRELAVTREYAAFAELPQSPLIVPLQVNNDLWLTIRAVDGIMIYFLQGSITIRLL
jgi:hypothetical protein